MNFFKILLFIIISFIFSCGSSLPSSIKTILKKRCNSCHSYKVYKRVEFHNKNKWELTLHKMILKGSYLTEDEYKKLLNYFGGK